MFYTDLETSKKLKEWGCDLEASYPIIKDGTDYKTVDIGYREVIDGERGSCRSIVLDDIDTVVESENIAGVKSYHLLEDVCCRYAKEFFGGEEIEEDYIDKQYSEPTEMILEYLQNGKTKEANEYLLGHTIFNPKNR